MFIRNIGKNSKIGKHLNGHTNINDWAHDGKDSYIRTPSGWKKFGDGERSNPSSDISLKNHTNIVKKEENSLNFLDLKERLKALETKTPSGDNFQILPDVYDITEDFLNNTPKTISLQGFYEFEAVKVSIKGTYTAEYDGLLTIFSINNEKIIPVTENQVSIDYSVESSEDSVYYVYSNFFNSAISNSFKKMESYSVGINQSNIILTVEPVNFKHITPEERPLLV